MKSIEQLEQEAKQARYDMREVMLDEFGIGATLSDRILSLMIRAVQSNIAHNDAKQEVSGDGSGEALPEVSQEDTEVIALMKEALKEIERNTCSHEETHRGGAIWEICDICGCKWADDEGGKPEFVELKIVTDLRNYIEKSKVIAQEERDSDGWIKWFGNECPVPPHTKVKVEFETGIFGSKLVNPFYEGIAENFYWYHDINDCKIIAYRIAK